MNKISLLTMFFIVFIPLAALLERYLKRRLQGPFVPLRRAREKSVR